MVPESGSQRERGRGRSPNPLWRGPFGGLALALLALLYWGTVGWLVAWRSRTMQPSPLELGVPELVHVDHGDFGDGDGDLGNFGADDGYDVPGWRPFDLFAPHGTDCWPGPRLLGLAWGMPATLLTDLPRGWPPGTRPYRSASLRSAALRSLGSDEALGAFTPPGPRAMHGLLGRFGAERELQLDFRPVDARW